MARRLITFVLRAVARVFFRNIEIVGSIPDDAPVIFAVNHPNALIDPLFLLCFAPRRVSFLAKAPIFTMPVIGWLARALDSIPVYRRQDNVSAGSNEETFARARAILATGGAIAIFPEGVTHSEPKMRELKTGVSRIALGASIRVLIVPTGLYYTSKHTFRSSALVYFGEPILVEPQGDDPSLVSALTARIEESLAAVTLQADSHEALELIARAERVFSANRKQSLAEELELRKRFVIGYRYLCEHDRARLNRLEAAIRHIEVPEQPARRNFARLLAVPFGVIGGVVHWPVYKLIDAIASRSDDEMAATVKVFAGALLYPLLWIALAIAIGVRVTPMYGVMTFISLPLLGYCAVIAGEAWDAFTVRAPDVAAIREEIIRVADEMSARVS